MLDTGILSAKKKLTSVLNRAKRSTWYERLRRIRYIRASVDYPLFLLVAVLWLPAAFLGLLGLWIAVARDYLLDKIDKIVYNNNCR